MTRVCSSFASRHARPEHGAVTDPMERPSLPATTFRALRILAPDDLGTVSGEAGVSRRPFARPLRLSLSGPPQRGRRSWPATSAPRRSAIEPVRSKAPFLGSVPGSRGLSSPPARCPIRGTDAPNGDRTLLCFGTSQSLRFNARPVSRSGGLPPRNARFRSLPASGSFSHPPADHRSRSVSFRVARCSANLLEPSP